MRLVIKRCKICHALGLGPNAVKLWPFEGFLYCQNCYSEPLQWHERRQHVTGGIQRMDELEKYITFVRKRGVVLKGSWQEWEPYIYDLCNMAAFGLLHGDKRTFVYYFSRAMYAWTLKEIK